MSAPSLQDILLGGFAYFLESGITVDAQTVAATVKPDDAPTTNWSDYSLGTVLDFKFGQEKTDSNFMRPNPAGGYEQVNRSFVTQDHVTIKTREMGELVWRLQMGLSSAIVEATPQSPATKLDRKIEGWLRLKGKNVTGYDRFTMDWWCEVRLDGENTFDEKVVTPSLRFTLIKAVDGTTVAGNTTNFPAQA